RALPPHGRTPAARGFGLSRHGRPAHRGAAKAGRRAAPLAGTGGARAGRFAGRCERAHGVFGKTAPQGGTRMNAEFIDRLAQGLSAMGVPYRAPMLETLARFQGKLLAANARGFPAWV